MLDNCDYNLQHTWQHFIRTKNNILRELMAKVDLMSPMKTLQRGYSISTFAGRAISSINDVNTGDSIEITLKDGILNTKITKIKKEDRTI